MAGLEITLRPTGEFQTVMGVRCRRWVGKTADGFPIFALIPVVAVHNDASPEVHEAFAAALQEVEVTHNLVSYDLRLFVD